MILEAGVSEIQEEVQNVIIEISLKHSNNKSRSRRVFYQQPGVVLMKKYDLVSREKCWQLNQIDIENEVTQVRIEMPV